MPFHVKRLVIQNDKLQKRCDLKPYLPVSQATHSSTIIGKQELKIRTKNKRKRLTTSRRAVGELQESF